MFSDRYLFFKIGTSVLLLFFLSLYMAEAGSEYQKEKSKCLAQGGSRLQAIEQDVLVSARITNGYEVHDGYKTFQVISRQYNEIKMGDRIRVLLKCKEENLELLKFEPIGSLRLVKIGVSFFALIVSIVLFFREFSFKIRKNGIFFSKRGD